LALLRPSHATAPSEPSSSAIATDGTLRSGVAARVPPGHARADRPTPPRHRFPSDLEPSGGGGGGGRAPPTDGRYEDGDSTVATPRFCSSIQTVFRSPAIYLFPSGAQVRTLPTSMNQLFDPRDGGAVHPSRCQRG